MGIDQKEIKNENISQHRMLYCVRGIIGSVSVAIIACCIVVIKTKHKTIGTSDHVIHMDVCMMLYSRKYLARLFKLLDRIPNWIYDTKGGTIYNTIKY